MHLSQEIDIEVKGRSPNRIGSIPHWFKAARKLIPSIPSTDHPSKWVIKSTAVSLAAVVFHMESDTDFCTVVIKRRE